MSNQIYEKITNQIIEAIESGNLKWMKSWSGGLPSSFVSKKSYRGVNAFMCQLHRFRNDFNSTKFLTFNQVKALGGHVKKDAKSIPIIYYMMREVKEEVDGEMVTKTFPMMKSYNVFNIEQTTIKDTEKVKDFNNITECDKIIKGYKNKPKFNIGSPSYNPKTDIINMPNKNDFNSEEEYYSTTFHEMVHSTGHETRLNREGIIGTIAFGSEIYSQEELIAELGSCFLCGHARIEKSTINNSSAYIQSWLKNLKSDKRFIFRAMTKAQKSIDLIIKK